MRQTSRAVALLLALESAQASVTTLNIGAAYAKEPGSNAEFQDYAAAWNLANPAYSDTTSRPSNLSNRQGAYQTEFPQNWSWDTVKIQAANTVASNFKLSKTNIATDLDQASAVVVKPGSGCMACLGSSMTNVWCSRTFSYLITSSSQLYQYENLAQGKSMAAQIPTTDAEAQKGDYDGGSCCDTNANFLFQTGQLNLGAVIASSWKYTTSAKSTDVSTETGGIPDGSPNGATGWAATCVAITNKAYTIASDSITLDQGQFEAGATPYSSWWCSNGLYKNVIDATNVTINQNQTFLSASNQRRELARVGCPQRSTFCGGVAAIYTPTLTKATPVEIKMTPAMTIPSSGVPSGISTMDEKCTWAAGSYAWAPTFKLTKGADAGGNTAAGITTANWQIHTMEYTTATTWTADGGALQQMTLVNDKTDGFIKANTGVSLTYLPLFAMPAAQFATLRTWYGDGGANVDDTVLKNYPASWYAPGRVGPTGLTFSVKAAEATAEVAGQQFGNVAHMPASTSFTATSSATAVPAASSATTSTGNYGLLYQVTSANANARFDLRVVRYMPAQVAQSVWAAGDALLKQYNAEKSSYDTAKSTWDAYVAILSKNAKMDAFAAAFSPPKAPTVPPLPNKPWAPAAYSGFVAQSQVEKELMLANSAGDSVLSKDAQPTAQQFWTSLAAAQTIGGWGSWTATILTYREGWGKSFGTIGYSGQGTASSLSVVWNPKWACGSSALATAATATTACQKTYTGVLATDTLTLAEAKGAATANTTARLVVVVSLWSLGNKNTTDGTTNAVWTGKQSLLLTWTGASWSPALAGLSAIAAPTPATDAASLSGIAGAQALAASTAAALAAAAALY